MKPAVVADEMFPEGAGPYMDLEEVNVFNYFTVLAVTKLKQNNLIISL